MIAGPNGAGKTTFAREFLPQEGGIVHFVNADSIASGLSLLKPELMAIAAGRLFLKELDRLASSRVDFAFESTLSGVSYASRLKRWRSQGYSIELIYLKVDTVNLALRRVAARVRQGGHNVSRADLVRRFSRSERNFEQTYKPLADRWTLYDNSGERPVVILHGP